MKEAHVDGAIEMFKLAWKASTAGHLLYFVSPSYELEEVAPYGDNLLLQYINPKDTKLIFDKNFSIQSLETLDPKGNRIKSAYDFESYESQYLLKMCEFRSPGTYLKAVIDYKLVDGIKIPSKILTHTSAEGSSDIIKYEVYISEVSVHFKKAAKSDRYHNSDYNFSIKFPNDWEITEKDNQISAISPLSASDNIRESVVISVYDFNESVDFVKDSLEVLKSFPNFQLHEQKTDIIDNTEASYKIFSFDAEAGNIKMLMYLFANDKMIYELIVAGLSTTFSENKKRFEEIAQSFRFE